MRFFSLSLSLFLVSTELIAQDIPKTDTDTTLSGKIDVMPSYPGGLTAWRRFLEKNLKAETAIDNGAPAGKYTVWASFIVDKEGNVSDVKTQNNPGYGMAEEVIRLISKSGQWTAGKMGDRNVKTFFRQPITFMVPTDFLEVVCPAGTYTLFENSPNEVSFLPLKGKASDLNFSISRGSITAISEGKYNIVVSGTERVLLQVKDKKGKLVEQISFEVKPKEQPAKISQ